MGCRETLVFRVDFTMRNVRQTNNLRTGRGRCRTHRTAFSLAELVISIGILILMMALAGQVFSITVRSTGQATALTDITQQIRTMEDSFRDDLRGVRPGEALIYIQGNPVNAYWTRDGLEADALIDGKPETGYPHISDPERERVDAAGKPILDADKSPIPVSPRADVLMIFASRKGSSYVNPEVTGRMQQIVYGHAELGDYVADSTPGAASYSFMSDQQDQSGASTSIYPLDALKSSRVAASQWHLGRRNVLLLPADSDQLPSGMSAAQRMKWNDAYKSGGQGMSEMVMREGQTDLLWGVDFARRVLRPSGKATDPWFLPDVFYTQTEEIVGLSSRGMLDATPPPTYASRMGQYFMPHCASFKVEWSLDPRSPFVAGRLDGVNETFWFDPGDAGDPGRPTFKPPDPLYSLQARIDSLVGKTDKDSVRLRRVLTDLLCAQTRHADGRIYSLSDRFRGVTCSGSGYDSNYAWEQLSTDKRRPNTIVFPAAKPEPSGEPTPDDIWPAALRITVDLFDREARLDRPIRHVMIIPVGG